MINRNLVINLISTFFAIWSAYHVVNWLSRGTEAGKVPRHDFEYAISPSNIRPIPLATSLAPIDIESVHDTVNPRSFDASRMGGRISLSLLLHALRIWGVERTNPGGDLAWLSPGDAKRNAWMVECLTHNDLYRSRCSIYRTNLLMKSDFGIRVVTAGDYSFQAVETSYHFGEYVEAMAEARVPATKQIEEMDGLIGTLGDIVRDTAARINIDEELEFAVSGLCRYSKGKQVWTNRAGQQFSFDSLAAMLTGNRLGEGACGGLHVAYALVMMLRTDQLNPLLSEASEANIRNYLTRISQSLVKAQKEDGSWDWDWPGYSTGGVITEVPRLYDHPDMKRAVVTGHCLEWMVYAPADLRPPDKCMIDASNYLSRHWRRFHDLYQKDWHNYAAVSHAANALMLLHRDHDTEGSLEHRTSSDSSHQSRSN